MQLTERVVFKTMLQRGNRIQVPKLVRWRYKLDTYQIFNVNVTCANLFCVGRESFLARMSKDGRIVIPKLVLAMLGHQKPTLEGYIMDVILDPS